MITDEIKALTRRISQAATEDGSAKLSDIIVAMAFAYVSMCRAFKEEGVTDEQVLEAAHGMVDVSNEIIKKMMESANGQV
tara:strand:+ start:41 stop:280 length:240 start_codon:yes stop_codon:yes gene_type:complete